MHAWFARPMVLLLLILIPALAGLYIFLQRFSTPKDGIVHANPYILEKISHQNNSTRGHASFIAVLCALGLLTIALAGPFHSDPKSSREAIAVLVIDTSISMESSDVSPTRIIAAKRAAQDFIDHIDPDVHIGIISFNSDATIEAEPTVDHKRLKSAIEDLELDTYTATGKGIDAALYMISQFKERIGGNNPQIGQIILESDGKETVPAYPDMPGGEYVMARKAQQMQVPIHTISFGTTHGTIKYKGTDQPVPVDDASLAQVAKISGGKAFTARNMGQLESVYTSLSKDIVVNKIREEKPFWYLIIATIALISALFLSFGKEAFSSSSDRHSNESARLERSSKARRTYL